MNLSYSYDHLLIGPSKKPQESSERLTPDSEKHFKTPRHVRRCNNCMKEEDELDDVILRGCSRCDEVLYCSRKCETDDWPEHKMHCKLTAPIHRRRISASNVNTLQESPGGSIFTRTISQPGYESSLGRLAAIPSGVNLSGMRTETTTSSTVQAQQMPARVWPGNDHLSDMFRPYEGEPIEGLLYHKPERIALKLLIDSFRVYSEDLRRERGLHVTETEPNSPVQSIFSIDATGSFDHGVSEPATLLPESFVPSIQADTPKYIEGHSYQHLRNYLAQAESMRGVLPVWWDRNKRDECEKLALDLWHWADVKSDIPKEIVAEEHRYGSPEMRDALRKLGARITYGLHVPDW
ncbi:hypothetical protein M501DRAFT_1056740 [Patellaria atrata CBS 101060]|uniref:MYND-type domain-containing protein n=1 Tax=Patellaria atrata CBS 101060 TaxID=1346257 RepID=A0A9P4SD04_9PEZI|nr:hypothetical protein M501DRAFT_1056740 [Patellaria atrata CBS 101060]